MANFELDPEFFLPPGHNIIDGGPDRLPRTYTTPAVPITTRHERFVIADVHPAPPADNVIQVRQEVAALLLHRGLHVRFGQPWIEGVGLFELRDAAESYAAVHMVPQEVAHNSVVRFLRHDQGVGFRGQEGFREGCLMILGVPLDFRNTEDLRAAVNTFGEFHHWVSDDPYLVRSIVFASFPDDRLVPRSINFSEYATWGGAKVSDRLVYITGAARFCLMMRIPCPSMATLTRSVDISFMIICKLLYPRILCWLGMRCLWRLKIEWFLLLMPEVGDSRLLPLMEEDGNLKRPRKHLLPILFRIKSLW
ncbi:hypothetical protein ZWY2020_059031 [Hordeum vulgare]|nr:hypothetical protein ZWY2020_059031 [Hordeum vulgare]